MSRQLEALLVELARGVLLLIGVGALGYAAGILLAMAFKP